MPAGRVRVCAGIAVALAMTVGVGTGPVGASQRSASVRSATTSTLVAPGPCPATIGEAAVTEGMVGTGWTVTTGDTPRPFRVKILGTLVDGIAPGRNLIIIKVSDLPGERVISEGHGIWAGMSGSPVYLNGKLAGAVSYGFSYGPSRIGGMTPARQMQRIASYSSSAARDRQTVRLTKTLRTTVAREAGVSTASASTLSRLAVPVVITGARGAIRNKLTNALRREFGSIKVMSGSAASAGTSSTLAPAPVPGGNLAGVISSGDITIAAVGTTTSVCGDTVLGFGHPMTGDGKVAFGAARASSITIVDDPTGTPFKLANIGRMFGLLDQDRLSGIRATIGTKPRSILLTARVRAADSGYIRTGHTSVTTSSWVPIVAANHMLYDIMTTADSEGGGTAVLDWTIRGTRPNGQKWALVRSDRVANTSSVGLEAGQLLLDQLDEIESTPSEKVRFDSVTMHATVSPIVKAYFIRSALVSRNGGPWKSRSSITARPGDELRFKVSLKIYKGGTTSTIVSLKVPATATGGGYLTIGADQFGPDSECAYDPTACPTTFNGLLKSLRTAPRNDDLRVTMDLSGFEEDGIKVSSTKRLDKVVEGSIEFPIEIH